VKRESKSEMKETEKAYIAGIIDGEGSITLTRQHKNRHPSPMVSIPSTDLYLLEWIKKVVQCGRIIKKKNYKPQLHRDSFVLNITYDKALELLKEVEPYLITRQKKARAKLLISEYKKVTLRNGRYNSDALQRKEAFYEKFMSL